MFHIENICIIGFAICIIGLVCYKFEIVKANSWEEAIKKMFPALWKLIKRICVALRKPMKIIFKFFYEGFTNQDLVKAMVDTSRILMNAEVMDLVNRLSNKPYDTPTLTSYIANINGIAWYDIGALRLVSAYKDLLFDDFVRMISNIIQNYFMETRGIGVDLYIKVATPTRLYFAIALSENGKAFLEQQEANNKLKESESIIAIPLEEEIEIFSNSESENK